MQLNESDAPGNNQQGAEPPNRRKRKEDHLVKLILIGDKNVGKTCLVVRYFDNRFQEENLNTIGVS